MHNNIKDTNIQPISVNIQMCTEDFSPGTEMRKTSTLLLNNKIVIQLPGKMSLYTKDLVYNESLAGLITN